MYRNTRASDHPKMRGRDPQRRSDYRRLFRNFVSIAVLSSVVPLLAVGWGLIIHYSGFTESRVSEVFRERVASHKKTIDLFLNQRGSILRLIAHAHTREDLCNTDYLGGVFDFLNQEYGDSFTDLGLIDDTGKHLAYIGPYDLLDKNYTEALWFKEVMKRGFYISDIFLGFRKVPHFIIAVTRTENGHDWILRATIDTEAFRSLLEEVKFGRTGEVYLVNSEGFFQTRPRFGGRIMDRAPFSVQPIHDGISVQTIDSGGPPRQMVAHAWLTSVRWLLMVRQDYTEAFYDIEHLNFTTLLFLHVSVLAILLVSVFSASYMIKVIKNREEETNRVNEQLMQAGKMASIGELSAGVAHEVNNPLAIISTERQILLDEMALTPHLDKGFSAQMQKSLSQIDTQIKRCKHTTQNLLRFSRRTGSRLAEVNVNAFLAELIELLEREAKSSGIEFIAEFDDAIPSIRTDPSQIQQVFLNIITNAIDAHDGKPHGNIRIKSAADSDNHGVRIEVSDTGGGIRPEHLGKIFDPFFTTKPVGKGTGLGLSICYSTIKQLGGEIDVASWPGEGTVFGILLPVSPPSLSDRKLGFDGDAC